VTDSLDRRTPSGGVPSLPSSRADGGRILRAGVFFGPFPLTARLNPREGAPRGLLTSVPGTADRATSREPPRREGTPCTRPATDRRRPPPLRGGFGFFSFPRPPKEGRDGRVKRHQCPRLVGLGATPLYWESFGFGRRGAPGAGSRHHAHCSSALILLKPPAPTYYAPSDHQTPPLRRATPTDGRVATETKTDGEETIADDRPAARSLDPLGPAIRRNPRPARAERRPREPSGGGAPRTSPRAGGSTSLGREVPTRRGFLSGNRRLRSINSCRFEARTAPETEDRRRRASEVAPRRRSPETEAGTGPPGSGHDPPRPGLVRTVPPGEARAVRVRSRHEGAPSRRRYPSRATGGRAPPLEPHFTIDLRGPRPKPRTEHPFFLATGRSPPSNERRTRLLPQIDLFTGITRGKAGPRPSNE